MCRFSFLCSEIFQNLEHQTSSQTTNETANDGWSRSMNSMFICSLPSSGNTPHTKCSWFFAGDLRKYAIPCCFIMWNPCQLQGRISDWRNHRGGAISGEHTPEMHFVVRGASSRHVGYVCGGCHSFCFPGRWSVFKSDFRLGWAHIADISVHTASFSAWNGVCRLSVWMLPHLHCTFWFCTRVEKNAWNTCAEPPTAMVATTAKTTSLLSSFGCSNNSFVRFSDMQNIESTPKTTKATSARKCNINMVFLSVQACCRIFRRQQAWTQPAYFQCSVSTNELLPKTRLLTYATFLVLYNFHMHLSIPFIFYSTAHPVPLP